MHTTRTRIGLGLALLLTIVPASAFAQREAAGEPPARTVTPIRFIDMGELLMVGRTARPAVTFVDARQRAKFERLLKLKLDVVGGLRATARDASLR
ncbi:hypothetical protein L6V77_19985 [Myxococcota bacterium]|nr:hypothetical protein [Myxococcota bacterium]